MNKNKKFLLMAVVIGILVFAGAAFLLSKNDDSGSMEPLRADAALLIAPHSYVKGPADAKVTVVEFLDPECEACREMHPVVKQLMSEYDGKVRLVIRYMPFHGSSEYAAAALEEAREIGKFEEALDTLFESQPEWGSHHEPKPELIPEYLKKIGMKPETLDREYLLNKHRDKVMKDLDDGKKVGVVATPSFFVNGRKLYQMGYEPLKVLIDMELSGSK